LHGGYSETSEGYDLSVSDYTEIRKQQKRTGKMKFHLPCSFLLFKTF